jgi:ketosteroid isomerase-like protein
VSRENVDALRAVYNEWRKGNFRAGADLYDRHVLFVLHPGFPEAGVYVGMDQLREYMLGLLGAWTNFTIAAEDFIEAGDSVVVAAHQRGVGKGSGTPAELRYFTVWTFRGKAVIRFESFRDRAEALEAVGLRE